MAYINVGRVAGSRIYHGTLVNAGAIAAAYPQSLDGDTYINMATGDTFIFRATGELAGQGVWDVSVCMKAQGAVLQTTGASTADAMSQDASTKSFIPKAVVIFDGEAVMDQARTFNTSTAGYTHFVVDMTFLADSAGNKCSTLICNAQGENTCLFGTRQATSPDYFVGTVTISPSAIMFSQLRSAKLSATTSPALVSFVRINRLVGLKLW